MPINKEKKLTFIHIPKTGGSSIEKYFDMQYESCFYKPKHIYWINGIHYCMQHLTYPLLENKFGNLNDYTTFSCVRHPYDRIVSEYFYKFPNKEFNYNDFNKWLNNFLSNFKKDHQLPQHYFICDNNDDLLIDYLMYFENLQKDFNNFLKYINKEEGQLDIIRKSKNRRYKDYNFYLTDENKKLIYDIYKRDFIIFNYEL